MTVNQQKNFSGQSIWIIGASSGIGRALAQELARQGAKLALSARSADKLKTLWQDLGQDPEREHHIFPVDVTNIRSLMTTAHDVQSVMGSIDRIIFMAAIYEPNDFDTMDIYRAQQLVDTNLNGALNTIHAALPILDQQGRGQLALCGSVAGYRGLPTSQPYSATKAAIISLAESLHAEKPHLDIKVINPGFVKTPMTDKNEFSMPMMISPQQAAQSIAQGLLKKNFEIHFPKNFTYLMKFLQVLPPFLYFWLARKLVR